MRSNSKTLYSLLLISTIVGHVIHVPGFSKAYLFHVVLAIYLLTQMVAFAKKDDQPRNGAVNISSSLKKYLVFFGTFYLYILASGIWASSKKIYLMFLIIYSLMFILMLIIILENKEMTEFVHTVKILGMMFSLMIGIGTLEYLTSFRLSNSTFIQDYSGPLNDEIRAYFESVPTAFFSNPNNLATFITFGIAFIVPAFIYTKGRKHRIGLGLLMVASTLVLVYTDSRANYVALALILIFMTLIVLLRNGPKANLKFLTIAATTFTVFIGAVALGISQLETMPKQIEELIATMKLALSFNSGGEIIGVRGVLAKEIIEAVKLHPFGLGAGNNQNYLNSYGVTGIINPHNWWLELMADFGVIVLLAFIIFYIRILYQLFKFSVKKTPVSPFEICAMGCFLAQASFLISSTSPSTVAYFMPYWILNGLSLALINIAKLNEAKAMLKASVDLDLRQDSLNEESS